MNRKGDLGNTIYLALLAVAFVIFTYTLLTSYSGLFADEDPIGLYEGGILRLKGDQHLIESYLGNAARMASKSAVGALDESYDSWAGCGRGSFHTNLTTDVLGRARVKTFDVLCHTLSTDAAPADVCVPDVLGAYRSFFYPLMSDYVRNYDAVVDWDLPSLFEAYPMSLKQGLSVVFLDAVRLPITTEYGTIGWASFRPAFRYSSLTLGLDGLFDPDFFDSLKVVAEDCSYVPAAMMEDCILDAFGTPDVVQLASYYGYVNGQYVFSRLQGSKVRCFALHLPGPAEP